MHSVAHGDHHETDERPRGLPLLRAVRPRLHHGLELLLQPGPDLPGDEDRQAEDLPQRHGARVDHRRTGKVTAVSYIDKATRTEKQIRCRAVVLAASACESARLLLNSQGSGLSRTAWRTRRVWSGST